MPQHNWENTNNMPRFRNGIPDERRRLLNLDNDETVEEIVSIDNRESRRERGERNPVGRVGDLTTLSTNSEGWFTISTDRIHPDLLSNYEGAMRQIYYPYWGGCCEPSKPAFKYIKSHNYIPKEYNFQKTEQDDQNLFFGIELEIDGAGENDDNAKKILDIMGEDNCYIMHDGSLNNGLEITSMPLAYNYILNSNYKKLFEEIITMGYKSHDTETCGLHIHINKNYFSDDATMQDLNIAKVLYLVEKYWDNIVKFSRRSVNNLNKWATRYSMKNSMFDILSSAKNSRGKYFAVNLQHSNTIEFRMFRGTLKYETFLATIQFVKALVEVCKNGSLEEIQNMSWEDVVRSDYQELNNYLKIKNILK